MGEQVLEKPTQIPEQEIFNKEDRIVRGWGSVDVIDKEGEVLPIAEFKKIMPIVMKRGGNIMDRHSNRHVGKILGCEFLDKETPEGPRPGVYLTYMIFKDYEIDDMVWDGIKQGIYKGLSFGGMNKTLEYSFKDKEFATVLKDISGFEFSVVPDMANQESNNDQINYFAKSDKEKEHEEYNGDDPFLQSYSDVKKPFAGYKDFDACVKANSEKGDPQGYCSAIRNQVEKLESDDKVDNNEQKEKDSILPQDSDNSDKFLNNKIDNKTMAKDKVVETKKEGEEMPENNSMEERLSRIEQAVASLMEQKKEDPEEESKEEKKEEEPEEKPKEEEEEVEKEGQAVKLPKDTAEEINDADAKDPAGDEENDKVNFVEKKDIQKQIDSGIKKGLDDIRKQLKVPEAQTPRIGEDSLINKSENAKPKTWKDANARAANIRNKR